MKTFDYSFLKSDGFSSEIVTLLLEIEKARTRGLAMHKDYPDVFKNLEDISRVQSVKASNEIEGIVTTDKRIKDIVNESIEPLNHDEKEIAGYRDVLALIHNRYKEIQFTEQTILDFHRMMLELSAPSFRGRYKETDNLILQQDSFGRRSIRFRPLSAAETPIAMEQLVLAYLDANQDSGINHLLLIPCFILDFLCIHPFSDGNGRMSRLLSLFLLYQNHYDIGKYISFEKQIILYKSDYYDALKISSTDWITNKTDYRPFMINFLTTLYRCYMELDHRFDILNGVKLSKRRRIEETMATSLVPLSKAEIHAMWPDIGIDTLQKTLAFLLEKGKITKIGTFKDARYKKV